MSREYRFDIRPNGTNAVQIILGGQGLPVAGQTFDRNLPQLNSDQINSLRGGQPQPDVVELLSESVSEWLGQDLRQAIQMLIQQPATDTLRLIFAIDSSLLPKFGDVPIELLRTDPGIGHLVIHPRIDALIHLLPNVSGSSTSAALDWPMRVMLVRSNPTDLGGRVPAAIPIRDAILDFATQEFGSGMVQVDLLSSEQGALGRPSWSKFMEVVRSQYHVLVYLGHGDVQQILEDVPPLSVLQFESEDDPNFHESVSAKQLALVLHHDPIPVVVLAGCLTGAQPGVSAPSQLPIWMRGNQGVAQALVNRDSGVAFAVGMRSNIDATDAAFFLNEFFKSLFKTNRGNVELAVRAGRQKLFARKPHPPDWAAPIAFSSLAPEPIFGYLDKEIHFKMTDKLNMNLEARPRLLWPQLAELAPNIRHPSLMTAVEANRNEIRDEVLKQGAMLLPELTDAQIKSVAVLKITLEGQMSCSRLQARFQAQGLNFVKARATKVLADGGYQVLNDDQDPGVFQIQLKPGVNPPKQFPNGVIVEIEFSTADVRGVSPINLEVLSTDCRQPFWPGNNAVIVGAV